MQRLATTVAIAAWIGFLGVFAIELSAEAFAPGALLAVSTLSWTPALALHIGDIAAIAAHISITAKLVLSVTCLAIVVAFAFGLRDLHSRRSRSVARGETFAFAGAAAVAILAGASQMFQVPLLPIDLDGGLVWLAVALTLGAVGFDRLVAIEEGEAEQEEAEFHAGLSALAEMLGRQTALYTLPDAGPSDVKKDHRP